MSDSNKTLEDLKLEAKRHIAERSALYEDVVYDLSQDGITSNSFILRELMRRITYTNSSFEHLAE